MGSRCCGGVLEKTFLQTVFVILLVVMAEQSGMVSSFKLCPATGTNFVSLNNTEVLLVPSNQRYIKFNVSLDICDTKEHFKLDLAYINRHYKAKFLRYYGSKKYYQIRFRVNNAALFPKMYVTVEASKTYILTSNRFMFHCDFPFYNVTSDATENLRKICKGSLDNGGLTQHDYLYEDIIGNTFDYDDDGDETNTKLHELWQGLEDINNNNNDQVYNRPSYRGGHIVFIPVGAILFMLSICLRFCLCRRKKMIQRVRTITVVRRVSSPTSSGAEANEPTSPDPMDMPPSYAEIAVEPPPPAYSELENSGELKPRQEQQQQQPPNEDTSKEYSAANPSPTDGDLGVAETRSTLTRVLTAGSRSLKSQFAFQPMKEEEED